MQFNSDATSAALTAFIIANNHPATLVEQPFFKEFVESFKAPEFNILSACDMEKKIMQSHSHRTSEIISVLTQEGNGRLSVAINLWTYGNTYAVVAVVVSWLTCNFEMKEATIGLREIRGEHTSARIAATYLEILREYNIENHVRIQRVYLFHEQGVNFFFFFWLFFRFFVSPWLIPSPI